MFIYLFQHNEEIFLNIAFEESSLDGFLLLGNKYQKYKSALDFPVEVICRFPKNGLYRTLILFTVHCKVMVCVNFNFF